MAKLTLQQKMRIHESDTNLYLNRDTQRAIMQAFLYPAVLEAYIRVRKKNEKKNKKGKPR
jgi:hypothetical protein